MGETGGQEEERQEAVDHEVAGRELLGRVVREAAERPLHLPVGLEVVWAGLSQWAIELLKLYDVENLVAQ
jgi:hypothetical protein